MTTQEIIELLDSMLFPFENCKDNINANTNLSQNSVTALYTVVDNLATQVAEYDYHKALKNVADIIIAEKLLNTKTVKSSRSKSIPYKPVTMPFLIQQVLFYIAVYCSDLRIQNVKILDELETNGVKLGHNFFSGLNQTPQGYCDKINFCYETEINGNTEKFSQLPSLFKYNGQKDRYLGVAIKNLVYQSGKYNTFVDLFGGSGAASVSFPRQRNAKYVYNELNLNIVNLYRVIVSNHKELIAELESLKKDLNEEQVWLNINFDREMNTFYNRSTESKPKKKVDDKIRRNSEEDNIFDNRNKNFYEPYQEIMKYMERIRNNVTLMLDTFVFEYEGVVYTKADILENCLNGDHKDLWFLDYICNKDFYLELGNILTVPKHKGFLAESEDIPSNFKPSEILSVSDSAINALQYRFYKYYAYFSNILSNKTVGVSPVRRALALIFVNSLLTQNDAGISAINRMIYVHKYCSRQSPSYAWEYFLDPTIKRSRHNPKPQQSEVIKELHKWFSKINIKCMNAISVINMYQGDKTLFYSDSPYLGTEDYDTSDDVVVDEDSMLNQDVLDTLLTEQEDNIGVVPEFSTDDMEALIHSLKGADEQGDKFIFSCRACLTGDKAKKKRKDGERVNYDLVKHLFEKFNKTFLLNGSPLWVLTVLEESKKNVTNNIHTDFFEDLVAKNKVAEIMITNFEITDFKDDTGLYPNAVYKTYTYNDFLLKLLSVIK